VPLIAAVSGFLLAQTDMPHEIQMSISFMIGIFMIGLYGRFVNA
jgi:hypothetical protein